MCGFVYDEAKEGRRWPDLPDDWSCPVCGGPKSRFELAGGVPTESAAGPPDRRPPNKAVQAAPDRSPPSRSAGRVLRWPANPIRLAHRAFGYAFLAIYGVLLIQMVPRLWSYQIEFPARTVLHMALGMAIGAVLLLKIAIVRFFKRLDPALVPALGTSLLVASVVLIGISVPAALREAVATSRLFTPDNRERVRALLAETGLEDARCDRLASIDSLRAGQRILRRKCIDCHDLRTVLAKPRTPRHWRDLVRRMADRATVWNRMDEQQQWQVTAYLVALSPRLQRSARQQRQAAERQEQAKRAAAAAGEPDAYDADLAKRLFETKCSQCHETSVVDETPPGSSEEIQELIARMVEEGLEATEQEIAQLVRYLNETYARRSE